MQENGLKTTIRLTDADLQILKKLQSYTGLKNSQIIRAALRTMLRRIELRQDGS